MPGHPGMNGIPVSHNCISFSREFSLVFDCLPRAFLSTSVPWCSGSAVRLIITQGFCAQILHLSPYEHH